MRVVVAGGSGLIGAELVRLLQEAGDEVTVLSRSARANGAQWNPAAGFVPAEVVENCDAVVNLAGASIGRLPWTKRYQSEIIQSRLQSTKTLVNAINAAKAKGVGPSVFISGSASGWYGSQGAQALTEDAPAGTGFLASLCAVWEAEAAKVEPAVRLVLARTGIVFSKRGGALSRLLPLIKLGLGGPLGNGKQWWPFITVTDEAQALVHLVHTESASGAFNLSAPEQANVKQIVSALATKLHRPALVPAPAFALRLALGLAADEMLLSSQRMDSSKLQSTGFSFEHPTLESAAAWVIQK